MIKSTNGKILWHEKMPLVIALIRALYELPGCSSGGMCHIVTDDDNVRDSDLLYVINQCRYYYERWPDHIENKLAELICETYLEMTYGQRLATIEMMFLGIEDEELFNAMNNEITDSVNSRIHEEIANGYIRDGDR